jgi:hypothetical protein
MAAKVTHGDGTCHKTAPVAEPSPTIVAPPVALLPVVIVRLRWEKT